MCDIDDNFRYIWSQNGSDATHTQLSVNFQHQKTKTLLIDSSEQVTNLFELSDKQSTQLCHPFKENLKKYKQYVVQSKEIDKVS